MDRESKFPEVNTWTLEDFSTSLKWCRQKQKKTNGNYNVSLQPSLHPSRDALIFIILKIAEDFML